MRVRGINGKRNCQPISRCSADQGRATHLHGADGMCRVVQCADAQPVQGVWQTGLVNDVDDALFWVGAQGAGGGAVDVHGVALWHSDQNI